MESISILEAPVQQLLCTNDEPSAQEIVSIRRAVQDAEEDIQAETLVTEQSRLRHSGIAAFIHVHNALLSPIRRVPVEIWELIFYQVICIKDSRSPEMTRRLGQVCRLWRSATKSLPELLAILPSVRLTPQTAKLSFVRSLEYLISTVPDTYPLSIRVLDPARDSVHPVMRLLYTHAKRWEYLSIAVDRAAIHSFSLPFYKTFSSLRRLRIYVPSSQNLDYAGQLDAFSGALLLTDFEVDSLAPIHLSLPWKKLKRYKERSSGIEIGLSRVLKDGAAIEHLEYRTGDPAAIIDIRTADRPSLTELKSIDIRLYHNSTVTFPFLNQFMAPNIEDIKIKDHGKGFLPLLLDFIGRCGCALTLTSLIIDTSVMNPGDLTKILLCTSALTKLECNNIPFVDLCMFSIRRGATTLVPLLHDFVIHSPSLSQIDFDALARTRSTANHLDHSFSLRLVFSHPRHCQEAMETLAPSNGEILYAIRSKLSDTLAELDIQVDEFKANAKNADSRRHFHAIWRSFYSDQNPGKKVNELISYLEMAPMEKMPESLHWAISVVERFRVLDFANVPQDEKYNLLHRADGLVYAWKDFRRRQTLENGWIVHGRFSVMYVNGVQALGTLQASIPLQYLPHRLNDFDVGSAGQSKEKNWRDSNHEKYIIRADHDNLWAHYDFSENAPISDYIRWRRNVNFHSES